MKNVGVDLNLDLNGVKKKSGIKKVTLKSHNKKKEYELSVINDEWAFEDYEEYDGHYVTMVLGDYDEVVSIDLIPSDWVLEFMYDGKVTLDTEIYEKDEVREIDDVDTRYGKVRILERTFKTKSDTVERRTYALLIWNGRYDSPTVNLCGRSILSSLDMELSDVAIKIFGEGTSENNRKDNGKEDMDYLTSLPSSKNKTNDSNQSDDSLNNTEIINGSDSSDSSDGLENAEHIEHLKLYESLEDINEEDVLNNLENLAKFYDV